MKAEKEDMKYYIGIIALAAILVGVLFITSMEDSAVVEMGDSIQVDYIGKLPDGTVFDTSDPEVAKSAGVYQEGRPYQPLPVVMGAQSVIKGFEDGLLGMKVGESKTLTIAPENGYGPLDTTKIDVVSQLDDISATQAFEFEREINVSAIQFNMTFGTDYEVGDIIPIPDSPINITILEIGETVRFSYNMEVGDRIEGGETMWVDEIIEVNSTHIVMKHDVEVGDIIQFPDRPWNSTVLEVTETNITLQHNPIPDTTTYITEQTMFGPQQVPVQVHFNETHIILDSNHFLAGKTLTFEVEVVAIEKANTELASTEMVSIE
jgi:FKBP-type peptidyl-prolyl cis-trans isomerase 2